MTIHEKLAEIQKELKAPKNQYNAYGKFSYRNCEDILEAVKPLCEKNKVVLFLNDEVLFIQTRFYIKATATLMDLEGAGVIDVSAYAREEESKKGMDGSQVTGAASSYARKYALNGMFCIDDAKDSDYTNQQPKDNGNQQRGGQRGPTQQQPPQQPAPQPAAPKCDNCKKDIMPIRRSDGSILTVEQIIYGSRKSYNKTLCYSCMKAEKKAREAAQQQKAEEAAAQYQQDAMNMNQYGEQYETEY